MTKNQEMPDQIRAFFISKKTGTEGPSQSISMYDLPVQGAGYLKEKISLDIDKGTLAYLAIGLINDRTLELLGSDDFQLSVTKNGESVSAQTLQEFKRILLGKVGLTEVDFEGDDDYINEVAK